LVTVGVLKKYAEKSLTVPPPVVIALLIVLAASNNCDPPALLYIPLLMVVPFELMDKPPILLPLVPNARENVAPESVLLAVKAPSALYILDPPKDDCATIFIRPPFSTKTESVPEPVDIDFTVSEPPRMDWPVVISNALKSAADVRVGEIYNPLVI